jgi:hypothetical protein
MIQTLAVYDRRSFTEPSLLLATLATSQETTPVQPRRWSDSPYQATVENVNQRRRNLLFENRQGILSTRGYQRALKRHALKPTPRDASTETFTAKPAVKAMWGDMEADRIVEKAMSWDFYSCRREPHHMMEWSDFWSLDQVVFYVSHCNFSTVLVV